MIPLKQHTKDTVGVCSARHRCSTSAANIISKYDASLDDPHPLLTPRVPTHIATLYYCCIDAVVETSTSRTTSHDPNSNVVRLAATPDVLQEKIQQSKRPTTKQFFQQQRRNTNARPGSGGGGYPGSRARCPSQQEVGVQGLNTCFLSLKTWWVHTGKPRRPIPPVVEGVTSILQNCGNGGVAARSSNGSIVRIASM